MKSKKGDVWIGERYHRKKAVKEKPKKGLA
jgi:hypothetical protein